MALGDPGPEVEQSSYEDDLQILRVIEAYCTSKQRQTITNSGRSATAGQGPPTLRHPASNNCLTQSPLLFHLDLPVPYVHFHRCVTLHLDCRCLLHPAPGSAHPQPHRPGRLLPAAPPQQLHRQRAGDQPGGLGAWSTCTCTCTGHSWSTCSTCSISTCSTRSISTCSTCSISPVECTSPPVGGLRAWDPSVWWPGVPGVPGVPVTPPQHPQAGLWVPHLWQRPRLHLPLPRLPPLHT